ncbi:MAG: hypothetical protein A2126_02060 [Candidatus Woykebacteria bacterium GWB1_45_5]|uniref:Uncharacterized protein n=2 Tax=Candidatus Woykeibacteriota TaxID=1817899 RepID=A0A1G1W499_9BACT|nr:MAG: hypothetical protein A2113_01795 [Candidatus Woykebacteria bacterium GWA1_44_8]OGY24562.1 MAG: hypothetical protein A2126_02060 [Candidatus Woykebacteria bacterium GWB1_45_5]
MRLDLVQFLTSITGISSITAVSLLAVKKYDLAATIFTALTIGAVGALWERYSRKSGAPLDLRAFRDKRLLDQEETEFVITHSPYPLLALFAYFLAKKRA